MITEVQGNLLEADADALVNTVNTVGVMGKGIALQFKRAFPQMFADYERQAKCGEIALGRVTVWSTGLMTGPRYIVNFPTKGHWKARSKITDVASGLASLIDTIRELGIQSIAVPPLGCGNGGLNWDEVKPVIIAAFEDVPEVDVLIYPPGATPDAAKMTDASKKPHMTPGRAALVALLRRYASVAMADPSLIESQKLMYFLQQAGEPLRLNFQKNRYGLYADNLRHVLRVVEGHYLVGYGDGSAKVTEAERLQVLGGADVLANEVLERHPETLRRIARVVELAEGFETEYGLELLATVHWIAQEEVAGAHPERVTEQVQRWSPRKGRMFTPRHVRLALEALRDNGWLPAAAA